MMIASSSAFLLVLWLWISLHLNDARVTLSLHRQFGLVPSIYQQYGGVSVTSYNEKCVWKCSKANNPLAAFKFNGALTENYCPKNCTANWVNLEAEYTKERVSLRINFNRLKNGSRLQADFSCTEGFDPLINGTEVENNRLQWSVSNIDSEHGWFKVKFPNGTFRRWRWRVRIECENLTITTPTTAPTTAATTSSNTTTTTSTTTSTTTLRTVSSGQITPVTPLPGEQFPTLSESAVSTEPSNLYLPTSSIAGYRRPSPHPERQRSLVPLAALAAVPVLVGVVLVSIFIRKRSLTKASQSSATRNGNRQPGIYKNTSAGRPGLKTLQYENIAANRPADKQPQDQSEDGTGNYASLSDECTEGGHEYSSLTVNDPTAVYYNIR